MTPTIALRRIGYRVAHRVLRVYWLLARPTLAGVKCVLLDGDRVLLVRHTYGVRDWDLPGGAVRRREPPRQAAVREMREELGVCAEWEPIGELRVRALHRRDTIHCFQARVRAPALRLDLGELADARWFQPDLIPPEKGPLVAEILARSEVGEPPGRARRAPAA